MGGPCETEEKCSANSERKSDRVWTITTVARRARALANGDAFVRKSGQGRQKSKRAPEAPAKVPDWAQKSGRDVSLNAIVKECNVTKWVARQVIHKDLQLKNVRRAQSKRMSGETRLKRLGRARDLSASIAKKKTSHSQNSADRRSAL